jgi:hypothetical protein
LTILLPLRPLLASRISAVPLLCSASAEFRNGFVGAEFFAEDVEPLAELLVLAVELELDDEDEPDGEFDELADVGVGAVGVKRVLPAPNPILGA